MRDMYVSEKSRSERVSESNAIRLVLNFGGDPHMAGRLIPNVFTLIYLSIMMNFKKATFHFF